MSKEKKVYFASIIFWIINLKIFFLTANWEQISQIYKYSDGWWQYLSQVWIFYLDFVKTIPTLTLVLTTLFIVLLFFFWLYYFKVYFYKFKKIDTEYTGIFGIFASVFTFLGFGCVACGQTLISSLLFLFVSNGTVYLAHTIGNLVIIIGIALLTYGIHKNYKMYHNKNICQI